MTRRTVQLEPALAAAYRAAVEPLVPAIEGALGPEVLANRARGRGQAPTTRLEPWRPARDAWRRALTSGLAEDPGRALVVADVRRCYDSIRPDVLAGGLVALGATHGEASDVRAILDRLGEPGLPVGPEPSAILANAVLCALDQAMREADVPYRRWVDDVVAFTGSRRAALGALDALRRAMDRVGLEPNASKTAVLADHERIRDHLLGRRPSTGGSHPVR